MAKAVSDYARSAGKAEMMEAAVAPHQEKSFLVVFDGHLPDRSDGQVCLQLVLVRFFRGDRIPDGMEKRIRFFLSVNLTIILLLLMTRSF